MSRRKILVLALFTLVVFSAIGILMIVNLLERDFVGVLYGDLVRPVTQVGIGAGFGWISAWLGWRLVSTNLLADSRRFFTNLIRPLKLSMMEIVFISLCAGVGEEILFRGAIQPYLGVWVTAVIFVAIHGYLNPGNWRLAIFGVFMTVVIAGIGYMARHLGLISAIIAHTAIDIYLLKALTENDEAE